MCHPGSPRANRRAEAATEQSSAVELNYLISTVVWFFPLWCRAGISELRKGNNFINKLYLGTKSGKYSAFFIYRFDNLSSEHWELLSRFLHKCETSTKVWKRCWKLPRIPCVDFTEPLQYLQQSRCLLTARKSICKCIFSKSFEVCFLGNHILYQTIIK